MRAAAAPSQASCVQQPHDASRVMKSHSSRQYGFLLHQASWHAARFCYTQTPGQVAALCCADWAGSLKVAAPPAGHCSVQALQSALVQRPWHATMIQAEDEQPAGRTAIGLNY